MVEVPLDLLEAKGPARPVPPVSRATSMAADEEISKAAGLLRRAERPGIVVGGVSYFGSQSWPLPASLMVGFFARALDDRIDVDGAEIEEARWFTRGQLRAGFEAGEVQVPKGVSISSSLSRRSYFSSWTPTSTS